MTVSSNYGKIFQEIDISRHKYVSTVLPAKTLYSKLLCSLWHRVNAYEKEHIYQKLKYLNASLITLEQNEPTTLENLLKTTIDYFEKGIIKAGDEFNAINHEAGEILSFYAPPRPSKQSPGTIVCDNFKKFALIMLENNIVRPEHRVGLQKQVRWTLQKQANPPNDLAKIVWKEFLKLRKLYDNEIHSKECEELLRLYVEAGTEYIEFTLKQNRGLI